MRAVAQSSVGTSDWRQTAVKALVPSPQEWRDLGGIFRRVADDIPLHLALRKAAGLERLQRRRNGNDTPVEATDLDLIKAQWLLFTSFLLPLVERQSAGKKARRDDMVRLKPGAPCQNCSCPTYLTEWNGKGPRRSYACPRCSAANLTVVETQPLATDSVLYKTTPAVDPKPRPKLRLVVVPKLTPPEEPPPPPSPPRRRQTFLELGSLSSLKEIWDEFAFHASESKQLLFPRFEENRKLRWTLHRALEAGAAQEFKQMTLFRASELMTFEFPSLKAMDQVIYVRAVKWLETKTPAMTKKERDDWGVLLCEAFRFGSITIVSMTLHGTLPAICDEIDQLIAKLEPVPRNRPRAPPRQRWRAALRNTFRWRFH